MDRNGGSLPEITALEGTVLSTPIPAGFHMVITNTETWDETISTGRYKDDIFSLNLKEGNYIRLSAANRTVNANDSHSLSQNTPPIILPAGTVCEGGGEAKDQDNYRILKATTGFYTDGGVTKKFWALKLPEGVTYPWDSNMQTLFDELNLSDQFTMDVRGFPYNTSFTPFNPALFEIETKDSGLDIYYETEKTYPINELNSFKLLDYSNCFSFGNGVESDRIRDDFNAPTLGKGVVASAVFEQTYEKERVKGGLIFSQIYNNTSADNGLNQFINAQNITKFLNPSYGSIQKLHSRDTDLVTLCEDKCLKVLANKDALFNADGNSNVTSNNNVLGQAIAFSGEFGISKNPESFASYGFRSYFADKKRGVVLRLSRDGLTEISAKGTQDFFSDNLARSFRVNGSYDQEKNSYNITMFQPSSPDQTLSFKENVDGWSSRKSFLPESGLSVNNSYFTFSLGKVYEHGTSSSLVNNFYGVQYESSVTFLFNDAATAVKGFKTLNYSGDKSRAYNDAKDTITTKGWYADSIQTDMQSGFIPYFVKKENKWFNYIKGNELSVDTTSLAVQGLGVPFFTALQSPGGAVFKLDGLNSSLEKGDKLYFLVNGNPTEIGTVNNFSIDTASNGDLVCNVSVSTLVSSLPTTSDFLFFAKDTGPNLTSLTGYYAEVTMKNDNTADGPQELFSVATEIFQSSK